MHTLGCRLNQAETALLTDRFLSRGYDVVDRGEDADLFVINTCSVTRGSERKCRRLIRFLKKKSPGAKIVVTGCYAQLDPAAIGAIDGVDLIVGTADKSDVPVLVGELDGASSPRTVISPIGRKAFTQEGAGRFRETRANLKIQEGCDTFCSFCVIPFTRGRARSRDLEDCLREARELVERGHREIVLSGVNLGCYESGGVGLCGLVERLTGLSGIDRVRISSIEPMGGADDLARLMAGNNKLCPYVHLVLQSGDDGVLRAMNRPYTVAEYTALLERFLVSTSDIGVGTDVLVGFPGESDRAFRNTVDLLEAYPFYHFHVFAYSEHSCTRSARMPDKVHTETIRKRSEEVRALGRSKKLRFHEKQMGKDLDVLFETRDREGRWNGHAPNYVKIAVRSNENLSNRIARVRVEEVFVDEVRGTIVEMSG